MKKIVLCLLFLVCLFNYVVAQERLTSPTGISIVHPDKWKLASKDDFADSVKKLDFTEEQLERLLKSNGSLLIWGFLKYDPKGHPGIIPTIQIRMLSNPTTSFESFTKAYKGLRERDKDLFQNLKIESPIKEDWIGAQRALSLTFAYELYKGGLTFDVRTRAFAVPVGKHFFQITFIDDPTTEDCQKEFDEIVKSIRIENIKKRL